MTHVNPRIYWDMDGLLADFQRASLAVHGLTMPYLDMQYDYISQVGFAYVGDPAFWAPLENVEFWATLPPLPDGMETLWRVSERVASNRMSVCSSGLCPGSVDGKVLWLRKHAPVFVDGHKVRAAFCTDKHQVAAPCKLLIDDVETVVDGFVKHGGRGVLIPRPWNRRKHELSGDGSFSVDKLVDEILQEADTLGLLTR